MTTQRGVEGYATPHRSDWMVLIAIVSLAMRLLIALALGLAIFAVPTSATGGSCSLKLDLNVNGLPTGATYAAKARKLQVEKPQTDSQRAMVYLALESVSPGFRQCFALWRVRNIRLVNGHPKDTPGDWHRVQLVRDTEHGGYRSAAFRHPAVGYVEASFRLRRV